MNARRDLSLGREGTALGAQWICPVRECAAPNRLPRPLEGGRRWNGRATCRKCGQAAHLSGLSLYEPHAPGNLLAFEVRETTRAS